MSIERPLDNVPITDSARAVLRRDAKDRGTTLELLAAAILEDYARNNAIGDRFAKARRDVEKRLSREASGA